MRALLALVLLGGCFKPSPGEGFACGPDRWCPDPLSCGLDNICRSDNPDPSGDGGPGGDGQPTGPANVAFVTSMTYTPQQIIGVDGADTICAGLGAAIGKPGRYVAWVSTTAAPAAQRLGTASGWVRTDGKPFAASKQELLAGKILYPLRRDENGDEVLGPVLTGTLPDGTSSENCVDFTSTSGTELALLGFTDGAVPFWTNGSEGPCNGNYHLYCLQADLSNPVAAPPSSNAKMFLSSLYTPGGGITTADAKCQSDATANSISGSFVALLSSTSAAAVSRLDLNTDLAWVRVDNVEVTADFASYDGTPSVTANGTHVVADVFSGAVSPFSTSMSGADSCNDWASGSVSIVGVSTRGLPGETFGARTDTCAPHRLYCFEKR
jgi:hypothetical protein